MEADDHKRNMSRRDFLRRVGMGAGSAMAMSVLGPLRALANDEKQSTAPNRMTYRVQLCHRTWRELFRHRPDVYGRPFRGAHR